MGLTRFGTKALIFYGTLVFAFFAAPYMNVFFMLLSFCSVIAVMSILWAYRNLAGVSGEVGDLPPIPADAGHLMRATLRCGRRVRHDLRIEMRLGDRDHTVLPTFELQPGGDRAVDVMLPALPRGVHEVHRARLTSIYPFGLIYNHRKMGTPKNILVHPKPTDLAAFRERNQSAGQSLGGIHALEMGPSGLREYREGDDLRNIHWKASARRHQPVVREFEGDSAPGIEVLLDLRAHGGELEDALSLITALALECKDNKELITLYTQQHHGTYGEGHEAFDELLAYLARVQPVTDNCPPPTVSPAVLRLPLEGVR